MTDAKQFECLGCLQPSASADRQSSVRLGDLQPSSFIPRPSSSGRVIEVVDGDTFWLSSRNVRIRVWGLDAPETEEPGGSHATAMLSKLIAGQELSCRQRDIDRYGRIVGQCFLPDGQDIAAEMIASDTAQEYCRFSEGYYGTC